MNDTGIETKENKQAIIQYLLTGLIGAVVILAGFNAKSYIEGIAAETYKNQGLEPTEMKEKLAAIEAKLEGINGRVDDVRADIRTLIQSL